GRIVSIQPDFPQKPGPETAQEIGPGNVKRRPHCRRRPEQPAYACGYFHDVMSRGVMFPKWTVARRKGRSSDRNLLDASGRHQTKRGQAGHEEIAAALDGDEP